MIALVRIKGRVGLSRDINETLDRLRLRKKYTCVIIEGTPEQTGMLERIQDFVAYGDITEDTLKQLITKRGKKGKDGKLKPFFRLHPPRKGIESKKHFGVGKGVLGNNKEKINDLILRML